MKPAVTTTSTTPPPAASLTGEGNGISVRAALAWEPTPEDSTIQWTVGTVDDLFAAVYEQQSQQSSHDYPFPVTVTVWEWQVFSLDGRELGCGKSRDESAAKDAAVRHLLANAAGLATRAPTA